SHRYILRSRERGSARRSPSAAGASSCPPPTAPSTPWTWRRRHEPIADCGLRIAEGGARGGEWGNRNMGKWGPPSPASSSIYSIPSFPIEQPWARTPGNGCLPDFGAAHALRPCLGAIPAGAGADGAGDGGGASEAGGGLLRRFGEHGEPGEVQPAAG